MSQQEFAATIAERQELCRMQEELDALTEDVRDRIKTHMGEAGELTAGAFKVT